MSWIQRLCETYDNCQSMIGVVSNGNDVPLLPIYHTTQMAHVEIVLDGRGNFRRAIVVPEEDARTIIPCSEESSGRTSGEAAHPLCDKLQYVAADYKKFGGSKDSYFSLYNQKLGAWCNSIYAHPKAFAVWEYTKKGDIIRDLIDEGVFIIDQNGMLLAGWDKESNPNVKKPDIFEVLKAQGDAFIRWQVEIPGILESRVWMDPSVWKRWIDYYFDTRKGKSLCYVSGRVEITALQHPSKLRNDGDKAKLISSGKSRSKKGGVFVDDGCGFTFLGRFINADQVATVGLETTQKAHLALRWLISRQGYRKGDLAIVAWATSNVSVINPVENPLSILEFDKVQYDKLPDAAIVQNVPVELTKMIGGYGNKIGNTTGIEVMALDSATPGRMAVTYYRELTDSDFLQRIHNWQETCGWIHRYGTVEIKDPQTGKTILRHFAFYGAPAPEDIAEAAYGHHANDKLVKATIARILPCIIESQPIPRDLVVSAVRRASNRVAMEHEEWEKTLSIACSLFKKYNRKEKYDMALDPDRKSRDYLYGRLLALADSLEGWALNEAGEMRETNAARLMQRFSEHPYTTWRTIELAIAPAKVRLGAKSNKWKGIIDEVIVSFNDTDFISDKKLSGEFLLGYHCQREYLRPPK
jgi:CRISPR-associated protein Csd1